MIPRHTLFLTLLSLSSDFGFVVLSPRYLLPCCTKKYLLVFMSAYPTLLHCITPTPVSFVNALVCCHYEMYFLTLKPFGDILILAFHKLILRHKDSIYKRY